jgi:hypothetical protein
MISLLEVPRSSTEHLYTSTTKQRRKEKQLARLVENVDSQHSRLYQLNVEIVLDIVKALENKVRQALRRS